MRRAPPYASDMIPQLKIAVFLVVTAGLLWLSWRSLRDVRSHGFYRFFAWGAILALVLVNRDYWFEAPIGPRPLASWLLLITSIYPGLHGAILLRRMGKPDSERVDTRLYGIERTTELVTVGIYRYIRHPLYSSLMLLTWGALLKHVTWLSIALALVSSVLLSITAWREEAENIAFFGREYLDYMKRTRRFIPYVF